MSSNGEQNHGSGSNESDHSGQGQGGGSNPGLGSGGDPGKGEKPGHGDGGPQKFEIQIDRTKYEVTLTVMTGAQLRQVPPGGIPADRDLFEVVPGAPDKKIGDSDKVEIRNGLRFFTAPGQINPGAR